ncbi:MAG: DUF2326 domain-containing protein [Parcubacteria group bacterium]|jgi:uncharacterized protein YydD (DUF2326 family)
MFLSKLYSEPSGLFESIEFVDGLNFIFAKKDNKSDKKKSLNGIGKSLLLNLLDYCLLSSETQHIKSAKSNNELDDYSVVLEFIVDDKIYVVKRSFKTPNQDILFGEKDKELKYYGNTKKDKELSRILCDLIFKDANYNGKYSNEWLRKLLPFFIKNQSTNAKVNFKDPIKFLHNNSKEEELIPLHLFLMGIDNTVFYRNFVVCSDIKALRPAIREVTNLVQEKYGLNDISQAESEIDKLKSQISSLEKNIDSFKLAEQYEDVEKESNKLTSQIKELWHDNYSDRRKIEFYEESFSLKDDVNVAKIKKIYSELNELLAGNIKKTLDDAINFRKAISQSRKDFLSSEIHSLKESIKDKSNKINELEEKRSKLFQFLSAKKAINDLSEAYMNLSRKRDEMSDLDGRIKTYRDLRNEMAEREVESAKLYVEIEAFSQKIKKELSEFRNVFFEIHDAIYVENEGDSAFIFSPKKRKDSRIDMNVVLSSDLSYGKNKGRTLIYDLAILFNAIRRNLCGPKFLVHDGIFDGIDKAHFISLYEFLENLSKTGTKFQYIVTLNEEGTLNDNFGNSDKVNPEKISEESIITLTPSTPLLGKNWK